MFNVGSRQKTYQGRTSQLPNYPLTDPMCGITALGSSELLASHFATLLFLEIMTYPWFRNFKVFYQCLKTFYSIAFALTAPIKPFVKKFPDSVNKAI